MSTITDLELSQMLRAKSITPTAQRIEIFRALLNQQDHLSAEDLFAMVNRGSSAVSKATVYNTASLFVKRHLIREVFADPTKVFYDPNTDQHHHFYNVITGKLVDIPAAQICLKELPPLPDGTQVEGVDIVVRIRPKGS